MSFIIHHGDCLEVLAGLAAESLEACVCDPPYGLKFMGKGWDHGVPGVPYWQAVLRVLKPGAHLLAFGGTRTFHRLACGSNSHPQGRWPANVLHDGSAEVLEVFPAQSGARAPVLGIEPSAVSAVVYGGRKRVAGVFHADLGSAARFFYCAKASRNDREEGLGESGKQKAESRNHHPTVKPTKLMRYLCRLVTPPGGTVLDPFCGSGSTGKAALIEGFNFVGIEREAEYVALARARCAHAGQGN